MGSGATDAPSTAYSAALLEEAGIRQRASPADAFRAAVQVFLEEPRFDMGRLAARLGISKPTLYRWTGPREQLIGEVLSYLSDISWDEAIVATTGLWGVERLLAVHRHYVGAIVAFEPLRRFVRNETPLALRILTMRGSAVQSAVSKHVADFLQQEQERGSLQLRSSAADVAYAMTKVTEGFIYSDPVANIDPDIGAAAGIIRQLVE
jgi:AcrR family transcriptional regulator